MDVFIEEMAAKHGFDRGELQRAFGKIQGLLTFSSMPFGVLAPWLLGYIFDRQGDYQMGVQGLVIVTALAIPFCFLLRLPARPAPQ